MFKEAKVLPQPHLYSERQNIYLSAFTYSGSNWLVGCLIDLNARISNRPHSIYLIPRFGKANPLLENPMEFAPVLCDKTFFKPMWHDIPNPYLASSGKIITCIRDPRDAIWSKYCGMQSTLSFAEFVLKLNLANEWRQYHEAYLNLANIYFVKFESFKREPVKQLKAVLNFCEITIAEQLVERVVTANDFNHGKKAEQARLASLAEHERKQKVIEYRSGKIGEWKTKTEYREVFEYIKQQASPIMQIFNYD